MQPSKNGPFAEMDDDAIAVIGLSCRFPGDATTPQTFWDMLCNGRSSASKIPGTRWNTEGWHHNVKGRRNTVVTPQGYFLSSDISAFDAEFFHINQAEAVAMDPQQRIMLEVVYETLENAGLRIEDISGSQTACYVGAFTSDWREMQFRDLDSAPTLAVTGSGIELLANRTSWFYDLRGPSVTVSTACSASMVSIHLACQSLRTGEATMALAGGANLFLSPEVFALLSNQNFLSPDGMCHSFDASGNGYARGEGVAAVLLKRAKDAIRDGDTIRAIIRGSGSNQDGKTPTMTMPNGAAQADLIRSTYKLAGLNPSETNYCEAHGTGTAAGDPAELSGLAQTLCENRDPAKPLFVGSVKTNIGHLESVAGLAGVIKAILVLEAGVIPPSLHFKTPNPKIHFKEWNITVPTTATPWPYAGPRRASVNSFGYGGANAHVILEDAYHYLAERNLLQQGHHRTKLPALTNGIHTNGKTNGLLHGKNNVLINGTNGATNGVAKKIHRHLFVLSTTDEEGIDRMSSDLAGYLDTHKDISILPDLAHTLERRSRFPWKSFYAASSTTELQDALAKNAGSSHVSTKVPKLGFVFTGQGAQWARMGAELSQFDVCRKAFEDADAYLRDTLSCPWSVVEELAKEEASSNINQPFYSQALCTVVQVAIVDLLASWNVNPVAVVGHSSGEIAAAYCLGALSKQDAWKAAYFRGYLCSQQQLAGKKHGTMMAVGASRERAREFTKRATTGTCLVACVNSPTSVTVSGDSQAVEEVRELLQKEGIFARPLKVQAAYHSHHMASLAGPYLDALSDMDTLPGHPGRKMFSSVTGEYIEPDELGPTNWVRNLISPVLFSDAVAEMTKAGGADLFVEIGPHPALKGPVRQIAGNNTEYLSTLVRGVDSVESLLDFAGNAFIHGVPIDLSKVNNGAGKFISDLPSYPWNHTRKFWSESRISKTNRLRKAPRGSLLGAPYAPMTRDGQLWRGFIRVSEEPWIRDHNIQGSILYPAAGFLSMAIEAARQADFDQEHQKSVSAYLLRDVHIDSALVLADTSDAECIIELRPSEPGAAWQRFSISTSQDGGNLQEHCSGLLLLEYESPKGSSAAFEKALDDEGRIVAYQRAEGLVKQSIDENKFYEDLSSIGMTYGPAFRNVHVVRVGEWTSCCTLTIPSNSVINSPQVSAFDRPHIIHPTVLDAMLHAAFAASMGAGVNEAAVPSSIRELVITADMPFGGGAILQGSATTKRHGYSAFMSDVDFLDASCTKPVVKIVGLRCVKVASLPSGQNASASSKSLCSQIIWTPVLSSAPQLLPHLPSAIRPLSKLVHDHQAAENDKALEGLVSHSVRRALENVKASEVTSEKLREVYRWLSQKIDVAATPSTKERTDFLDGGSVPEANIEQYLCAIEDLGGRVSFNRADLQHFLPRLENILRGEPYVPHTGPVLIGADEAVFTVIETLKAFALWRPGSDVLLIDSGYDGVTERALNNIRSVTSSGVLLDTVAITFASNRPSALANASSAFPNVTSVLFGLDKDLAAQTLKEHSFDAVFISGGLSYSQEDLSSSLGRLKSLLRPSGCLYTVELTNPSISRLPSLLGFQNLFTRPNGPSPFDVFPREAWESALTENGFQLDFAFPEQQDSEALETTLFAASIPSETAPSKVDEVILLQPAAPSERVKELAKGVTEALESISIVVKPETWGDAYPVTTGSSFISLLEVDFDFIANLSPGSFAKLQELVFNASTVLWVTGSDRPEHELVTGLARTIKNEVASVGFSVLHSDDSTSNDVVSSTIARLSVAGMGDDEYLLRGGSLYTNRIVEDTTLNKQVGEMLDHKTSEELTLGESRLPLLLSIAQPGLLDSLCFTEDKSAALPIGVDEVEIDVKATGLNFRDVMVCLGQIPDNLLGFEASGLVRRIGSSVTRFKPGDAVCVLGHGAHRTLFRSKDLFCQHMPPNMSFEEAAGLPLVHATAYHALVNVARLEKGQSVLIHAAAGGVGQAAVQLAQHLGLEIYGTVGSPDKKKLLQDLYGIEESHLFHSRDTSFAKGIMRATNQRGVDCVLNSLSGEALRASWSCIAPFGSFVEIGIKDILANSALEMRPFIQDASFSFLNLEHVQRRRPELMGDILEKTFTLLRQGLTRGVQPQNTYPISRVEDAFRLMASGKHQGKITISYNDDAKIPVELDPAASINLSKGTYVLVGGLGGLGRSLARLLVECGARNISFISRSGSLTEPPAVASLVEELAGISVNVTHYKCDISNEEALRSTLERCGSENPPIAGVIQCAMVLRDCLFSTMTHRQWIESLAPKVEGTRNLAKNLPKNLDFFILLSSFSGIFGNMGQSNYAAGCTFQDATAHALRSLGHNAVSIDLGIMRDVGVLAEQGAKGHHLRDWEEPFGIREDEFHALIKAVISGVAKDDKTFPTQIVTGLATGGAAAKAGIADPFYFSTSKFLPMSFTGKGAVGTDQTISVLEELARTETFEARVVVIEGAVVGKVATIVSTAASNIDISKPLHDYGVDSLVALELSNWCLKEIGVPVSTFDLLKSSPISALCEEIARRSQGEAK